MTGQTEHGRDRLVVFETDLSLPAVAEPKPNGSYAEYGEISSLVLWLGFLPECEWKSAPMRGHLAMRACDGGMRGAAVPNGTRAVEVQVVPDG